MPNLNDKVTINLTTMNLDYISLIKHSRTAFFSTNHTNWKKNYIFEIQL
jgi:hypothetical protein